MRWTLRGKSNATDTVLIVEAASAEEAECIGWKRGMFVTSVTPPDSAPAGTRIDSMVSSAAKFLWHHAAPEKRPAV